MRRLAFIRLLAQQGLEQSKLPDPLAASCILTFHDAVELFLMLASEHRGITVQDRGTDFVSRYFGGMHPEKAGERGVDLAGRLAIKRLTTHRNAFKHEAAHPTSSTVSQARNDTTQFFEENTPRVFGIPFTGIDMVDLVPQEDARSKLKEAVQTWRDGDQVNGMGHLAAAFRGLFDQHLTGPDYFQSPFAFGPSISSKPMLGVKVARTLTSADGSTRSRNPTRAAEEFGRQFDALTDAVGKMQAALRVMTLGVDLHRFYRFQELCPNVLEYGDGRVEYRTYGPYSPSDEHFDYCQQFVITAALRLAELESHTMPPPWRT
ncbi:hypothetical protein [Streptomyces sp. PA03-2a]|uniref:hypothetical protein n=1 Tax=Streptomyces sp. PA03-2a TaxID=3028701 RepID=UPI0029ACF18A|nr:hypothetical protein [Streptomyces sp. PA03-2a]MDX2731191.1 hypothetical protein [Streptomyces sp. PA03-2a]